ncbi:bifunctional 4-hydroxy-2-oxoglutarate aldolase/2-dehydro-3-deoxy-phosphogluconate aldolase [Desulfotomaculum defluvii]
MTQLARLSKVGVIPVVRGSQPETILLLAKALQAGGIDTIEITLETPGALEAIRKVSTEMGETFLVGAGTVLDGETARLAILAGAQFIVSPSLHPAVITVAKRYGKPVAPGAMSPTEIVRAYELGADMVKVFPASTLGPKYIKDIRGPLGHIPLMATGGINENNAADFIKAGCKAIGVGGSLVSRQVIEEGNWSYITEKAGHLVEAVRAARSEK